MSLQMSSNKHIYKIKTDGCDIMQILRKALGIKYGNVTHKGIIFVNARFACNVFGQFTTHWTQHQYETFSLGEFNKWKYIPSWKCTLFIITKPSMHLRERRTNAKQKNWPLPEHLHPHSKFQSHTAAKPYHVQLDCQFNSFRYIFEVFGGEPIWIYP